MNELVKFARQILEQQQAHASVPSSMPASTDWLPKWRELAQMTAGLEPDDPRLTPVLSALAVCERSYKVVDVAGFTTAAKQVQRLMRFVPGSNVTWHGNQGHRLTILGPAMVEHVHYADGRLWVWVDWQGQGRWVNECIVTEIREHL